MTERKAITDKMKWQSLLYWSTDAYCPECFEPILATDNIEWDHRCALIHGGKHHYDNIRPMHTTCHTQKTIRDVKANAKVKRLIRGKRPSKHPMKSSGRKLQSRPFQRKAG